MSKEKQIDYKEFARQMRQVATVFNGTEPAVVCSKELWEYIASMVESFAGRRKQSENTVEVVRCKYCKFNVANMEKDPLNITDYSGDDIVCSYFLTDGLEPTDFCSRGAKMKGGAGR